MSYIALEHIRVIAARHCGPDILVEGEPLAPHDYVVQRRAAEEGEENTEVVRIPGDWVLNQEWVRIEETIRKACK